MPGPPPLHLVAIGPRAVRVDGAPAPPEVLGPKHFALLIYLALSPGLSRSRGHIMAMLWPEAPDAKARHSLNEALHRLRACLGAGRLLTVGETVSLSGPGLTVDAWEAAQDQEGDFLEGFTLEGSQPFDEWVESERRSRRGAVLSALVQQAKRLLAEGASARAAAVARGARARDPLSEAALRVLMEALALQGDDGGALAELREYRRRLAEVDEAPSQALLGFAGRIRAGQLSAEPGAQASDSGLVGRAAALAALCERLPLPGHAAARVLIVLGGGGEGKTRMLRELERRATLAGITVASTRALPGDQGRPRSALRGLFRGGLLRAPGLSGADAIHLRSLASAVPELGERFPPQAAVDDGELAYALAAVLQTTAEDAPLLLLLDDAHLADGTSLGVLQAGLERLTSHRVTLALAAAPHDPDSAPELFRLAADTGRSLPGMTVSLEPFRHPEVAALVEELAPWAEPEAARDRLVRRLLHDTSGNPFLVVTLLRGLADIAELREHAVEWPVPSATLHAPLPGGVPQLIQSALFAQLGRLDRASREIVAIAATLGIDVDVPLLAEVTGLSAAELAERLAAAERLQLIVATAQGYGFPAAIVPAVLKQVGLTAGRRRELRLRAAELLARRGDSSSRLMRLELLAQSISPEALAAEAIELGEALLVQGNRHGARRIVGLLAGMSEAIPESHRGAWRALRDRLDGALTG